MNTDPSHSFRNKRVLVTGASGFLGRHLVKKLENMELSELILSKTPYGCNAEVDDWDLTRSDEVDELFISAVEGGKIDYVFNLAGYNGNIQMNLKQPSTIFMQSTLMNLNMLQACHEWDVGKVVSVVASCAYPHEELVTYECGSQWEDREIMEEDDFFDGPPHPSVECHGYAKRNLQLASHFYNQQYNSQFCTVCPPTLYGPGDRLDPDRTKVMMALIKKICDAKRNNEPLVSFWGSGKPLREFMFVEDAANLLIQAALHYDCSQYPLNIGTGQETSISKLVEVICTLVGYSGEIWWDTSKPDGAYRKRLDTTKMEETLGKYDFVPFVDGIKQTISWYISLNPAAYGQYCL